VGFFFAKKLATYTYDYASHSRLLKKFPKKTIAFVPPLPYFNPSNKQNKTDLKIKNKLSKIKKEKKHLIGFAGRFTEEKGFDILLKAGIELSKKRKDFVLLFAGQTNIAYEKTFLKNKLLVKALKDHLIFLGLLNDAQLNVFYQSLDLFVLSSRSECFALVQAEAMAQRTPILVSNIPGARDPVKQTNFGFLFESENSEDLEQKIEKYLNEPQIFDNQFSEVAKYFSYKKSKNDVLSFLNTI
jgi:glycosyltransferase involved in cell wall biosynthesis